ncbi:MAG: type II and III secretion system protein [Acidobacteria bacterium]|nr:type II and III secretion system protein [Acidobacteriota bacterium]
MLPVFLALGVVLFDSTVGVAQEATPEVPRPALATSAPFRLQSQVPSTSLELRRPTVRTLYEAIAQAYGIRLLYDRDLEESRQVGDFRIQDIPLEQALEAAGSISKTFVAPIDERTGIVAEDTPQKRGEYERQVLISFRMDSQTTPQQLTEISTALRNLLDLRRVAQDTRLQWISARGRPRQVESAEQFVETLQKEPGEVVLEVDVWEINLSRARELGLVPPQAFQLLYLGQSAASSAIPLLTFGQGRTLYGVRLPDSAARLEFSSSVVRSHQKLQLRASHGQPATLLVGQRFPITTVQVSSSLLQQPTGQQQGLDFAFFPTIQYEDLGVVLKATPHLHALREVTLDLDIALRNLGAQELNGIPVISNRQMISQARLRDGEAYLIGGLLSSREQTSRSGIPLLSRLPLIGYLFGARRKQRTETELLIQLRPYILRPAPAEEFASRTIFFGKEITGLPPAVEIPAAPTEAVPSVPGVPPTPPVPGQVPQPEVPAPGAIPPGIVVPPVPPPSGSEPQVAPPGVPFPGIFPPQTAPREEEP